MSAANAALWTSEVFLPEKYKLDLATCLRPGPVPTCPVHPKIGRTKSSSSRGKKC